MLRHYGSGRTYRHNIYLASTLSIVAGIVNITGWLALGVLTTNVTGHFVFFSEEIVYQNYQIALGFILLTSSFLLGAFMSSYFMERGRYNNQKHFVSYILPICIEIFAILCVALSDEFLENPENPPVWLAMLLLFAMGLQNALVTQVSRSVVRTTHLTGIFTDLGIELSQLLFYKSSEDRSTLKYSVFLKLMIIIGFSLGGGIGGFGYTLFGLKSLLFVVVILIAVLLYDNISIRKYIKQTRET